MVGRSKSERVLESSGRSGIIGITGGIGSGKSTIARRLAEYGYTLYLSDDEAKRLLVSDLSLRHEVEQLLGKEVYRHDRYQPEAVLSKLKSDPSLLEKLNGLVHPVVKADILACPKRPLLVESAILFESGIDSLCDCVIAVLAPREIRLARVLARDKNMTEADVLRRMEHQLSDDELRRRADICVLNDGSRTIEQVAEEIVNNEYLLSQRWDKSE